MPSGGQPLKEANINYAYHYAPMHYLPFILRSGELLSKNRLLADGFGTRHFRSTSSNQDKVRGFAAYVHASLSAHPPILKAKLGRGFPHVEFAIPVEAVEVRPYLLCRFNIAKTRYFRGAKQEPPETPANGRYLADLRLPVASTNGEKVNLLKANLGVRMIEVLIEDRLPLPRQTVITVFSDADLAIAQRLVREISKIPYPTAIDSSLAYPERQQIRKEVVSAMERAATEADWKGSGLEFDRV
jgi:hypothetical protein